MSKLNKSKGITLLEVICSLCIFTIMFLYIMNCYIRNVRLSKYNDEMNQTIQFVEALKNNLIYKCTYEEIKNIFYLYTDENAVEAFYINKENINIDILYHKEFKEIISREHNDPIFLEFRAKSIDENVININLKINIRSFIGDQTIETEIYKGDY